ncbi:MAG TPA: polysaccharide lyase 6 family protein [Chitinophagaceae bacterium]
MIRLLMLKCFALIILSGHANTIVVRNAEELSEANKKAIPGDIIILQNGEWKDVTILLNCNGTKEKPIIFKAQAAGKVLITGISKLKLGGQYIIVDGLYFTNGYAGKDAVISFRANNKQLANNCRVTNSAVSDFNNPKRMDENSWVAFYGKNNRLDHCSFTDKKNLGVLLAVILDDERSRENFHSIDHNYFGRRPPLASNGGEIIRIGVSQHCQFNSNTQVTNNFFEDCDGETEIISVKSCANEVKENVFKECQGSVVLRHGDNNLVRGNYFLGNDKPGSGGVRVINKGQKIVNNIFYKCRGVDFRSPLAIMNGIPNSPANRYVQVINAEINNNVFYECSPISFGEGSDTERTLPPAGVTIEKNIFYNSRDSIIYKVYDDITGMRFTGNKASKKINQSLVDGFNKTPLPEWKSLSLKETEVFKNSGAVWFMKKPAIYHKPIATADCATAEDIYKQLEKKEPMILRLTGEKYFFLRPAFINSSIEIQPGHKGTITLESENGIPGVFIISGNASLRISQTHFTAENVRAINFISSDTTGNASHYSFVFGGSSVTGLKTKHFFYAYKSSLADSIIIRKSSFTNCTGHFITMSEEKEDRGYYNAEKIFIGHNNFDRIDGTFLNIYRGGSDESTLGPHLVFSHNKIKNCNSAENSPLISLTGVQVTEIFSNNFSGCNAGSTLILYKDLVRAKHSFERNTLSGSGKPGTNKYVTEKDNMIR